MATSKNAKLEFESGQQNYDFALMTDSGDHKVHTVSGGTVFSGKSGYEPDVRPNGMVSGRNVLSTHATNDTVTVAAFTAYSGGTLYSVSATSLAITRAATDVAKICSITMNSSGTVAEVEGDDSADASFSEVRGAAGGPPSIPADSVEIGQVRVTTNTAGVIASTEIFQVVGTHAERFDYPLWDVNPVGEGDLADAAAKKTAFVEFNSELGLIHGATADAAADTYKQVYIQYYAPIFAEVSRSYDFVPAENTHSVTSTQVYNGTVGSVASTLGQGSFSALMGDNVTDALLQQQDEVITVRHYPDRNKTPYTLTQGTLGVSRTFPAADQNQADCTLSAEVGTVGFSS
jgi:hypothetical protein